MPTSIWSLFWLTRKVFQNSYYKYIQESQGKYLIVNENTLQQRNRKYKNVTNGKFRTTTKKKKSKILNSIDGPKW